MEGGHVVSTAVVLGTDSSGHTSYSLALEVPVVTRPVSVATAPDTTLTPAGMSSSLSTVIPRCSKHRTMHDTHHEDNSTATLVEGSTDAHLFGAVTVGSEVVTFNEDCGLNNDSAVCTLVAKNTATTVVSTVTTITPCAYPCPSIVTTASATPTNGVSRVGVTAASLLLVVGAAVTLSGAMT